MSTIPVVNLPVDYPTDVSDLGQESSYGGIDVPSDEFYQIHALSSKHPPPPRPGSQPKPPFRPQSQQSGHPKSFKGMMDPFIYHHSLQIVESGCNESIIGL